MSQQSVKSYYSRSMGTHPVTLKGIDMRHQAFRILKSRADNRANFPKTDRDALLIELGIGAPKSSTYALIESPRIELSKFVINFEQTL